MFKQNKWQAWYDSLPASTREYISKQPVWHDRDLAKAFAVGILVGIVIGAVL